MAFHSHHASEYTPPRCALTMSHRVFNVRGAVYGVGQFLASTYITSHLGVHYPQIR